MNRFSELRALPLRQGQEVLYSTEDEHGRILVLDDGNYRILTFDSIYEQSCMRLSDPHKLVHEYAQLMLLAVAFIEPRQITMLGLGGGSLLRTLHHLLPDCTFNVVELRQAVVDVATRYFALPDDPRVTISVRNALREIARLDSASSDIIFSDLYDAYSMEPAQLHYEFLTECVRVLSEQGWLVINVHRFPDDAPVYFELLSSLFPTVILSTTAENTILLASNAQPAQVTPGVQRIETMERVLQQRFSQLMPRLRPFDFELDL